MTHCNFHHNCNHNIFQRNEYFKYVYIDKRLRDNHLRHSHSHRTFNYCHYACKHNSVSDTEHFNQLLDSIWLRDLLDPTYIMKWSNYVKFLPSALHSPRVFRVRGLHLARHGPMLRPQPADLL